VNGLNRYSVVGYPSFTTLCTRNCNFEQKAAKIGDIGTDHDGFHPTAITAGSPDVFIDRIPVARVSDPLAPHDKPNNPPHPRTIVSGSSTVLVNGKPLAITGDAIDCGGAIIGLGTVFISDQAPAGRTAYGLKVNKPLLTILVLLPIPFGLKDMYHLSLATNESHLIF